MAAHQKILYIEKRGWKCMKHAEYPTNRREYKGRKTSRGRYKMLGDDKNVTEKRGHNITLGVKKYILRNEMRKYYYYTTSHGGNRLG